MCESITHPRFPFRSRFLELGDATLHYVDEGEGPVVLMIPGSPMWSYMYREAIAGLRDRYRCIAVDLPGLGLSRAPLHRGRAFADATELLTAFVQRLGLRDVVVCVHATAGPCGAAMAVRERDRIRGLVISNSFAWPLDRAARLRFFVRLVGSRLFAFLNVRLNALARITARFGRRGGRFDPDERRAILEPFERVAVRQHLQNYLRGVGLERARFAALEHELPALADRPTLLLYGKHDNGYRAGFVHTWQRHLPRHQVEVLEEAGHFPFEDAPDVAVSALRGWLDALPPVRPT